MTETIIVLATTFAGFLLIDPFFGGALTKATIAKWPLIALGFGSLAFHLVGRALTDPRRLRLAISEVLHDWWPIIVLAFFITAGSAYARFADSIRESFLGMGLGMFFLPLMAVAVRSSRHPVGFMQGLAQPVTMHLGQNRGRSNASHLGITAHHRLSGHNQTAGQSVAVNQHQGRLQGQALNRTAHGQQGRLQDVQAVDLLNAGASDGKRVGAPLDFLKQPLSHCRRELF